MEKRRDANRAMKKVLPWLIILFRLVLGYIFVDAGFDKILHPDTFARAIGNYHLLPWGLENAFAIVLPWVELLLGLGLIIGIYVDGSAVLSGALLLFFIFAIASAILRGYNIECGCGLREGQMVGMGKIVEDLVLLVMSIMILFRREKRCEYYPRTKA